MAPVTFSYIVIGAVATVDDRIVAGSAEDQVAWASLEESDKGS